ncbi:Tryptophan--tRNA ligase, mitochondrial, variant 2 [Metarhizium acridum]|uniref:Tryptophan--tRNA ligase, mitochondrial n=2 Tax=Metarhizium acridum TaxID=92637 RepID=UPI001C6BFB9D|nr:Tryptophan--tRNA ligase, mitochondrial [Metarhizium acridum]KAG8420418.1 Tryptophan--tRNA ligase, mitochondrial, variant 2 [Metarhizium acridum]
MQRLSNKSTAVRPKVIFSGIQPTGIPHLGNYVGALRQWVQLQHHEPKDTKLIYSIVDLHAITTPQSPEKLKQWKRESLAALLAVGIDPERSILFYQSSVPAHSELMWILACTASVGYLSRMTQWKQKLNLAPNSQMEDRPAESRLKLGLFSYPVLQAADILVHRATHVPVGHDQQQHLEFARECVTNFNHAYGECLIQPKTITPPVHRVMSLSDPTSKMSKSHKLARSRILITDTPDEIRLKISSALTDSVHGISYDPALRPGISNLLSLFSIFDAEKRSPEQLAQAYSDTHPRLFKDMVSDAITLGLQGIRTRYTELIDGDTHYLDHVAAEGARKALQSAEETMGMVRTAVGL